MSARQQLARLLPLALLVVLAIAGLRGAIPDPRWNGPLRGYGVAISIALEVVLGVLLVITLRREGAALRAARDRPYTEGDDEITAPVALRFVLKWVLGAGLIAVGAVLITNLHLHFFSGPLRLRRPINLPGFRRRPLPSGSKSGTPVHIPVGPILYGLLIAVLLAALIVSVWWAARLRQAAVPEPIPGDIAQDSAGLRRAVESGRAALASEIDDARAAIIACYLAMEATLAVRGTARGLADTPDELLARAVTSDIVRGTAARRLTRLFYEARFSSHPLGPRERDTASRALDDLSAELGAGVVP